MRGPAVLAALLFACGCAEKPRDPLHGPGKVGYVTPAMSGPVYLPEWVARHPTLTAEALFEVDLEEPPPGSPIEVMLPVFEEPASPTGLARGAYDYSSKVIRVGWRFRPYEERPLMPALAHEIQHAKTGDPCAGHRGEPGCP